MVMRLATIGTISSSGFESHSYGATGSWYVIDGNQVKLAADAYVDPYTKNIYSTSSSSYLPFSNTNDANFISFQDSNGIINNFESIQTTPILNGVQAANVPYFTGGPTDTRDLPTDAADANIRALLYEWPESTGKTTFYTSDLAQSVSAGDDTVITYSFVQDNSTKFASGYSSPTQSRCYFIYE